MAELENNKKLFQQIKLRSDNQTSKTVKIYESRVSVKDDEPLLQVEMLQIEGRNTVNWNDFVNGYCEPI